MRSAWLIAAAAAAVAGCAQVPPAERPPAAPASPPVASTPGPSRSVGEAIARHRKLADDARRSGDLAAAAQQLQVLTVLAPDEAAYARELASARAAIEKESRETLQSAVAALNAGDLDRATAAMLRVLALEPSQPDAAKALREIDRRRLSRIQADRAARVTQQGEAAARSSNARPQGQGEVNDGFDVEQAIEMVRAGDTSNGLRDLRAYVDANRGNRATRQRIGNAVADRARELEDQGSKEQAVALYEQAVALRGDAGAPWASRMTALKKSLSQDYLDRGTRAYRTNLAQAITFFETSVKYDPENTTASIKLKEAKMAREKLDKIK